MPRSYSMVGCGLRSSKMKILAIMIFLSEDLSSSTNWRGSDSTKPALEHLRGLQAAKKSTTPLGFICMGGTPSAAWLAQTPKLGGTPYTHKTNPVVIRGYVWAYITPRGRLIPKPHRGGAGGWLFHKPGLPAGVVVGSKNFSSKTGRINWRAPG